MQQTCGRVWLNGKLHALAGQSVGVALAALGYRMDRVAVEYNGVLLLPAAYETCILKPDDRLEVVQFVGGG